jgi:hypothetical protein
MNIQVKSSVSGEQTLNYLHEQPIQQHLVQAIVSQLCGNGVAPSTGISGARTTAVMENITR